MTTLFVSDLHLSASRPEKLRLLHELLDAAAARFATVYMLGDLFEIWAGDDDDTPPHPEILAALAGYTRAGGRLFVMRGNRDFLLGPGFIAATGAELLDDPSAIEFPGGRALLMHGDRLCTRDKSYQRYRRLVRAPAFRRTFLSLPARLRIGVAHGFQRYSERLSRAKPPVITDVEQSEVLRMLHDHGVYTLIHGHTHRPGIHQFTVAGRPARRIVLGDWYEQDSVLVSDDSGERLLGVKDWLAS